jgi:thioredoxin reductase (NADPH)
VTVGDPAGGEEAEIEAAGLFVLIGSVPRTAWLPESVERDAAGFVLAGPAEGDPGARMRRPLETTLPGVFAIGDVRAGSIKRVATAVGDGATVISTIHGYLAERQR